MSGFSGGGAGLGGGQSASVVKTDGDVTTTSTSFVDVTDLAITLTTTGGDVLLWFMGNVNNNTLGKSCYFDFAVDGSRVGQAKGLMARAQYYVGPSSSGVMMWAERGLAPGEHTFKVQWAVQAGTGTISANTNMGATFQVIELPS